MVKCVSILGSTGSIGRQSLDIISRLPGLRVAALTAGTSVERMAEQCRAFRPALAVMATEEAAKERAGAVRRSGLLLDDSAVLHAMEHSDTPQYLPLSSRRNADALASAEQLGLLARHIETTLLELAHELRDGSITADPYFRSGQDTACTHCDYLSVCHFTPGVEGDCHRVLTKLPADKIWSSLKGGEPDA